MAAEKARRSKAGSPPRGLMLPDESAPIFAHAGADVLVAGSAVFRGGSVETPEVYGENIRAIRAAAVG